MIYSERGILESLWEDQSYSKRLVFADWFDENGQPDVAVALRLGFQNSGKIGVAYGDGTGYSGSPAWGKGDGIGYGDGHRHGDGSGYGETQGYGYADGSGYGSGFAYGPGDGEGYGDGYGYCVSAAALAYNHKPQQMHMESGEVVLVKAGQGYVFLGRIAKALPPFGLVLEDAAIVERLGAVPWEHLCQGIIRESTTYRRFDGLFTLPNVISSVPWAGEIPDSTTPNETMASPNVMVSRSY